MCAEEARFVVSRKVLSELLGVTVKTVNNWARNGCLPRSVERGKWDLQAVLRHLLERIEAKGSTASLDEQLKIDKHNENVLRMAQKKGLLVFLDAVIREIGPWMMTLKAVTEAYALMKADPPATAEERAVREREYLAECDRALDDMRQGLLRLGKTGTRRAR